MMETTVSDFYTIFYIPAIQKLAFHLPHVRILCRNNCGEIRRTDFKQCESFQDVLCRRDYAERLVASEYYGGNRSVSMEGIALEKFSAFTKGRYQVIYNITSTSCSISIFLSEDSK